MLRSLLKKIQTTATTNRPKRSPQTAEPAESLSPQHVAWAYRLFLDREPESAEVLSAKLGVWRTTEELRNDFLSSAEFKARSQDGLGAFDVESNIVIKEIDAGLRTFIDLNDHMVGRRILRGTYETEELSFVRQVVKPGQTVLDIGANIGFFTIHMASLVEDSGRVYAFEPIPENLELLRRSVCENRFDDRVLVEPLAVGEASGAGHLVFLDLKHSANSGGSYLHQGDTPLPPGHELKDTQLMVLDDYDFRRPVSFIKIDIEGAEPLAFRGAEEILRSDQPIVLAEVNPAQLERVSSCTASQLISEMEQRNYDCHLLDNGQPGRRIREIVEPGLESVIFMPR